MSRYTVIFLNGYGKLADPIAVPSGEAMFWATVGDCAKNCAVTQPGAGRTLLPEDIREHEITASRIREAFETVNERRRSA